MTVPAAPAVPPVDSSPQIAGSVLPLQRAEELVLTLPGVLSARIMTGPTGAIEEIHVLTTMEVPAKATVRNIESALIAELGLRVNHRKISVATSMDAVKPVRVGAPASASPAPIALEGPSRRRLYFEDVEVRRSRTKGIACRVTLTKGAQTFIGEAEGMENERLRIELAARAALQAVVEAEGDSRRPLAIEGCRTIEAFDREFVFVGVSARYGRETGLLTGTAEVRDSAETASVLAVLDATNRWVEFGG